MEFPKYFKCNNINIKTWVGRKEEAIIYDCTNFSPLTDDPEVEKNKYFKKHDSNISTVSVHIISRNTF